MQGRGLQAKRKAGASKLIPVHAHIFYRQSGQTTCNVMYSSRLMVSSHRRRRRDSTIPSRRVGQCELAVRHYAEIPRQQFPRSILVANVTRGCC